MIPGLQSDQLDEIEIKSAFRMIDIDRKFQVDASDLRQMLQLAGEKATDQEVMEMIRLIDHDGSGEVQYEEFFEFFANPPPIFRNYDLAQGKMDSKVLMDDSFQREEEEEMLKRQQSKEQGEQRNDVMAEFTGDGMAPAQIKKYYQRFVDVDTDGSGLIGYDEFLQVLEGEDNSMHRRLFQMFDDDNSGEISLKEFIVGISSYTSAGPADKLKFAFMMFDEDASGYLDRQELMKIIKANAADQEPTEQYCSNRADQIYRQVGLPLDAQISFERFVKIAEDNPGLLLPAYSITQALHADTQV
jgi:Ca2+-binding EF-hand superfamily protein